MKGKVSFYFNAPNTGKVRSRIQNPSKELTGKIREAITEAIVETVNEQTVAIRAKLITKFAEMGETAKDAKAAAALASVLNPFFDVVASTDKNAWAGEEVEGEEAETEEAPAETTETAAGDDSFED